jgi:hypothetical protein
MSTTKTTGWTGWVVFAGVILMTVGIFTAVQGLVAIIGPSTYFLVTDGSLWLLDVTGWGWWNLIMGVLLVLVAVALLTGQTWARVIAVILVIINAVSAMLLIPAQPWWSLIVIAIDVLIIYALIVHGRELAEAE